MTRLMLAFRALRGLTDAEPAPSTVPREQYDDMRAFYQQQVLDLRKALDQMTRALIEERSPGTMARLNPSPIKPREIPEAEDEPEMIFP